MDVFRTAFDGGVRRWESSPVSGLPTCKNQSSIAKINVRGVNWIYIGLYISYFFREMVSEIVISPPDSNRWPSILGFKWLVDRFKSLPNKAAI